MVFPPTVFLAGGERGELGIAEPRGEPAAEAPPGNGERAGTPEPRGEPGVKPLSGADGEAGGESASMLARSWQV